VRAAWNSSLRLLASGCGKVDWMGGYQAVETYYDIQYKRNGIEKAAGEGATAQVRPCTDTRTHELRAVKSIEKVDWSTRGQALEEIQVLKAVSGQHPNIGQFFKFFEEWTVMNLIFEYCPKGSLEDLIDKQKLNVFESSHIAEGLVAKFMWQLLEALVFLQLKCILHRDVKPANLLLMDDSTVKLADFGVACFCSGPLRTFMGTPAFFPPEVHQLPRGKGYSFPLDVWATGVTMYMLLFKGDHPFVDRGAISKELLRSGQFEVGWLTSGKTKDLLDWIFMPCPDQRIIRKDALQHPWFAWHGMGKGEFVKERPAKLILDSHGNWLRSN